MGFPTIDSAIQEAVVCLDGGNDELTEITAIIAIAMALRDVVNLLDSISGHLATMPGVPNG